MNLKRIITLFWRDFRQGARGFLFIFSIVTPIVVSLILSLVFGTIFSGKPRLGIVDEGGSELARRAHALSSVIVKDYDSKQALIDAAGRGAIDVGMLLPATFDQDVRANTETEIVVYVWGESLVKDRAIIVTVISRTLRAMLGQAVPINIVTETVGTAESIPWQERLLPLVVLLAVFVGGFLVPATSLVEERQRRTLTAVSTTPATLGEVFAAKGLLGVLLSTLTGLIILAMNSAFGTRPALLLLTLVLAAAMATLIGLILGAVNKDINALFATVKSMGILLYAPAILYMFPNIPKWIGYLFPTYYAISPIIAISRDNAVLADVALELGVLLALIAVLIGVLALLSNRLKLREL